MTIVLPFGWSECSSKQEPILFSYQRTYPDGLNVLLMIETTHHGYELWSIAEHRCSGPTKHRDSVHQTVESALRAAMDEMVAWDRE